MHGIEHKIKLKKYVFDSYNEDSLCLLNLENSELNEVSLFILK